MKKVSSNYLDLVKLLLKYLLFVWNFLISFNSSSSKNKQILIHWKIVVEDLKVLLWKGVKLWFKEKSTTELLIVSFHLQSKTFFWEINKFVSYLTCTCDRQFAWPFWCSFYCWCLCLFNCVNMWVRIHSKCHSDNYNIQFSLTPKLVNINLVKLS